MERNSQKVGIISCLLLLVATGTSACVAEYLHWSVAWMGTAWLAFGLVVSVITFFLTRLQHREQLEQLEFDELKRGTAGTSLFTAETETFPARRSREIFERFVVPVITLLLGLAAAAMVFVEWKYLDKVFIPALDHATIGMSIYGLLGLVLFLVGKYAAGLARLQEDRLVRPNASFVLVGAYVCFLMMASLGAVQAGTIRFDIYLGRFLALLFALISLETFAVLVLEIYRPRTRRGPGRLLFDSRLAGLWAQPESVFLTAAHALDYQFGFQVSETWFYKFLERALGWLVLAQIAILLLSTCFVFIETGEQGVLERFGTPVHGRAILDPGIHLKLPYPIDRVMRYRTDQVQSFLVGVAGDEKQQTRTTLWTVKHFQEEFNLLVPAKGQLSLVTNAANGVPGRVPLPVNLLSVSIPIQFQITNLEQWVYKTDDPKELLEWIATREVVRYLASSDFNELLSSGREKAAEILRQKIQKGSVDHELGLRINFVGLQDLHPPVSVADQFEKVIGAHQASLAASLMARAYAVRTNALAESEAFRRRGQAEVERQGIELHARGQASLFTNQIPAFRSSPDVYALRSYLDTFVPASANSRKFVMAASSTNIVKSLYLNLEEKIRPDLSGLALPPEKPKTP